MNDQAHLKSEIQRLEREIARVKKEIPRAQKALEPHLLEVARELNKWHCKQVTGKDGIDTAHEATMPLARYLGTLEFDLKVALSMLKKRTEELKNLKR